MDSGSSTCVSYRNSPYLPSLTENNRRFLISPAVTPVISGRPDMVFGRGNKKGNNKDISPSSEDSDQKAKQLEETNSQEESATNKNDLNSKTEFATLKADIIKQGTDEANEIYKEPEHSFLKATSEDDYLEVNDSVSQYKPKIDGIAFKEDSFLNNNPTETANPTYITEVSDETDEEKQWNTALENTVPKLDCETGSDVVESSSKGERKSQGSAHVRLPSPSSPDKTSYWEKGRQYKRVPAKLFRLASLSARKCSDSDGQSQFYSQPKPAAKVISLEEAMNARPPLRIDMEGPTPCTYSPRNKPLREKNSPAWSFGQKCYIEKSGGARTSWGKMWFQTPHVWQNKVDFNAEVEWPSPNHYPQPSLIGARQTTVTESPSYTIGVRKNTSSNFKIGIENMPSPVDYDRQVADRHIHPRQPSFSHQFRREGTVLWGSVESTPGPGSYSPRSTGLHRSHTISGIRREKSHSLGPFSYL